MKKFLLQIVLFIFVFFILFGGPNILYSIILRVRTNFKLQENQTVVFVGDSYVERSINGNLIPCTFNFARSAEPYLDIYPRLKVLLEANPQISTVFIGATPLSLAVESDHRRIFLSDMIYLLRTNILFYSPEELSIIPPKSYLQTILNGRSTIKSIFLIVKTIAGKNVLLKDFGGFIESDMQHLEKSLISGKEERNRIWVNIDSPHYGNKLQVKYLKKILDLVQSHGARAILLSTPVYHEEEFFDVPYFENTMKTEFSNVEFWNYANFPVPDECRQDVKHLNKWGAEIFSKELARRMREEGIIPPDAPETESEGE